MRRQAAFAAVVAGAALLAVGCGSGAGGISDEMPAVPPPRAAPATMPNAVSIPDDILALPGPPADPDVRRVREDGADLPAQINPCGTAPPGQAGRVAGRQILLTSNRGTWKSERLVVYADGGAAATAMDELRDALARCARRDGEGGTTTRWTWAPLAIGEDALFVGGQTYRNSTPLRGHFRGVVMRQGRAVLVAFDFNRARTPPQAGETAEQQKHAREMATRLRDATWLGS